MTLIDLRRARDGLSIVDEPLPGRKPLRYERVVQLIERLVVEQNLRPGDLLPTQAELCELAGVSRITVTRALEELERAGRVRRHQGVGTYLARSKFVSEPARRGGLLGTLAGGGKEVRVGSRLISLTAGAPSPDLAATLGVPPTAKVWHLHRQRVLEGRPLVVESSVIPVSLAPDLEEHRDALAGSLYQLLQDRYGLRDEAEEQYLEVVAPTVEQRRLLHLAAHALVMRIRGLTVDQAGRPFDCFEQVYPATDFAFYLSGGTARKLLVDPGQRDWSVAAQSTAAARSSGRRACTPSDAVGTHDPNHQAGGDTT